MVFLDANVAPLTVVEGIHLGFNVMGASRALDGVGVHVNVEAAHPFVANDSLAIRLACSIVACALDTQTGFSSMPAGCICGPGFLLHVGTIGDVCKVASPTTIFQDEINRRCLQDIVIRQGVVVLI